MNDCWSCQRLQNERDELRKKLVEVTFALCKTLEHLPRHRVVFPVDTVALLQESEQSWIDKTLGMLERRTAYDPFTCESIVSYRMVPKS